MRTKGFLGLTVSGAVVLTAGSATALTLSNPLEITQQTLECWATASAVWQHAVGKLKKEGVEDDIAMLSRGEVALIDAMKAQSCVDTKTQSLINSQACLGRLASTLGAKQTFVERPTFNQALFDGHLAKSHVLMMYANTARTWAHTVVVYSANSTSFCFMDPYVGKRTCKAYSSFATAPGVSFFTTGYFGT